MNNLGLARFVRLDVRAVALAGATLLALLATLLLAEDAKAQTSGCGSVQARVDAAASGSTVDLPDGCVYRETVTIRKPLILKGGSGVEIRGSNVWTSWTRSGSYWVKGTLPSLSSTGNCKTNTDRCRRPEQVFFDGRALVQVPSSPKPGQFAVDGSRRVVLADDPTGHRVEVTVRQRWISGSSGGVTIEGFTMKHAANSAQSGAITNNGYDNWTVSNNNLSYAHGYNVGLGSGTGLKITGNDIHHGGQQGIGGSYASLEVRNNKIHDNNTEDFVTDWAAGGMKNTHMSRLVADGNTVYNNNGTGLWCDEGCRNVTISNNRVHHNTVRGIHFEISDGATIFGNVVWENGWGKRGYGFGEAGIHVTSSRDVAVYGNTLAWNNDGITVVNQDRPQGDGVQYDKVTNVRVYNNTILSKDYYSGQYPSLAWVKAYSGGNIFDAAANNRGYDNRYWYPASEGGTYRYKWNNDFKQIGGFNQTPGEERGRYLSSTEKNQVVTGKGIPANPER